MIYVNLFQSCILSWSWSPEILMFLSYLLSMFELLQNKYWHHTLLLMSCIKQVPVQVIFNLKSLKISGFLSEIAVVRKSWDLCVVTTGRKVYLTYQTYGPEIVGSWCAVFFTIRRQLICDSTFLCCCGSVYSVMLSVYGFNGDNCHFLLMLLLVESPWYASHR